MMDQVQTSNRFINSLRGKIIIILGLSCLILALLGAFSLYRIRQFHQTTHQIERESSRLLSDIRRNLKNMEFIGKIDSDINAYMLSGNSKTFDAIKGSLKYLQEELPRELQKETSVLLKDMNTLALRMESLKLNQKKVVEAENKAIKIFREAHATCKTEEKCQQFIEKLDFLFLEYREHSFAALSAQGRNFMVEQKKSNSIIDDCLKILSGAAKETFIHPDILSRLTNVFYDLSESFETIILIREKVWRTKGKLTGLLRKISIELDKGSGYMVRQTKSRIERDFEIAEQTSTLMLWSLAACGILLAIFGVFLTTYIINPLNKLGEILVKFSGFLVEHRADHKTRSYGQLISAMSSRRRDEIGYVTRAAKSLAVRVHDLSLFRRTIEADESALAIYRRLARIFSDKLGLRKFFIMETSENNEGMELVICQPRELADEIPVFLSAQTCRAIQTAFPVNSFEVPEICPVFPFSGNIKHICIPMIINREAIGVVSFLFEQTLNDKIALETEPISDTILHAVNYLNEALPLIQAKRYAHRLKTMALKDQLTGLFNRRYLDNSLDMLVAGAKRRESSIGLLMCDIDYFKQVNDQYGHDAGDAVLKQLANLLRTSVRASDIVVRFGGEEFLVLLNDCNDKEMEIRIAEKIRAAVAEHTFRFQEAAIKKTVSIGTSRFPYEGAKGIWEAIKFADIALYKAKELGRNRVVQFDHSL